MKNIFIESDYLEIRSRIEKLSDANERLWGNMNLEQMLIHCTTQLKLALGEISAEQQGPSFMRSKLGKWILFSTIPWPKNVGTPNEMNTELSGNFIFPDNTKHPLVVTKYENNSEETSTTDPTKEESHKLYFTVVEVKEFPEAMKPAFKMKIDFGEELGIKQSSAQITDHYTMKDLPGRQVICVVTFPPKQIGPFVSECLVTGLYREDGSVVLAVPDQEVRNGAKFG